MKFNKWILGLAAVGVMTVATCASAQTVDAFNALRTYVVAAPQNITAAAGTVTNGPTDHLKLFGRGILLFNTITNTGTTGGTLTATVYTSPDTTNLTTLANYALISSATTDNITNGFYGSTNLTAANSVLIPGTVTYPTAATAGYATPYLAPLAFTNSGAITLNGKPSVAIGFNITDQPRYLYVVYTAGGSVTNFSASADLIATPSVVP